MVGNHHQLTLPDQQQVIKQTLGPSRGCSHSLIHIIVWAPTREVLNICDFPPISRFFKKYFSDVQMLERLCQESDGFWSTLPPTTSPHHISTSLRAGAITDEIPSSTGTGLPLPGHWDTQSESSQLTAYLARSSALPSQPALLYFLSVLPCSQGSRDPDLRLNTEPLQFQLDIQVILLQEGGHLPGLKSGLLSHTWK